MYKEFFGLRRAPFENTPDPRFFFLSEQHEEALSTLIYAVSERKGLVVVTGAPGTGKTTVARSLLARLDPGSQVATVTHTTLAGPEVLQAICEEYRLWIPGDVGRVTLRQELEYFLSDLNRQGQGAVLVIDEAHRLAPDALEEIRLLGNLETEREKLVQIVLLGWPELHESMPAALAQRVALAATLGPLTPEECGEYVVHRLEAAGSNGGVRFSRDALAVLATSSEGLPRNLNVLCDHALLEAFARGDRKIGAELVEQVVAERVAV